MQIEKGLIATTRRSEMETLCHRHRDRDLHHATTPHLTQRIALTAALTLLTLATTACTETDTPETPVTGRTRSNATHATTDPNTHVVPSAEQPRIDVLAQPGSLVGQFELAAPSITPFVLHGTFPVPRGAFVQSDGNDPFHLVGPDGHEWLAQCETVTRYPDTNDGADVVEITSRVERPMSAAPGDRIRYDVRFQRHPTSAPQVPQSVTDYLATENAIVLRTRDVFDNLYTSDLWKDARTASGSTRMIKRGRTETQAATHSVLEPVTPVAGDHGTLPHMMGVHAYLTQYSSEPFVSLDLRVHNGFSGRDHNTTDDNPLGKIYFKSLELVVPQGWSVVSALDDPYLGTPYVENGSNVYPIVAPIEGANAGQLHMMPAMAQFHRRLALARTGSEARALATVREEGLAFARAGVAQNGREWFSWWNQYTDRWFAQRQRLPQLPANEAQVRTSLAQSFNTLANQLRTGATGNFPTEAPNMGWAHPWGVDDGGMVSGSEIFIYDGVDVAWSASREGYRTHELSHRMYSERQPNVIFDLDGRHTNAQEWTVHAAGGDYMPIWWFNSAMLWAADPFGYGQAPQFQVQAVTALNKKPWYEPQLLNWHPIDEQHLIRYTRSAKVLVWLGNDAIAKDDMMAQAEGFRIAFQTKPQDLWGNIIPTGLLAHQHYVAQFPQTGMPFGRGESWGLDASLVAYSIADDSWRAQARPWLDAILDVVESSQAECSGVVQATPQYNVFNSQYRCRQSIECAITENALVALRETAFLGVDPQRTERLNAVLRRSFYAMIGPLVWSPVYHGPWAMMAVGPFDMAQPLFCTWIPQDGNYGFADHYQIWSSFAYAWDITHDPVFLTKASEALGVNDFVSGVQANGLDNWQNKAAMLALAQQMAASHPGP